MERLTPRKMHEWSENKCLHCSITRRQYFDQEAKHYKYRYYHKSGAGTPIRKPLCYSRQLSINV